LCSRERGISTFSKALAENQRVNLIPFDSKRANDDEYSQESEGRIKMRSPRVLAWKFLKRCTRVFYDYECVLLTDETRKDIVKQMNDFASEGFRVLAMANKYSV